VPSRSRGAGSVCVPQRIGGPLDERRLDRRHGRIPVLLRAVVFALPAIEIVDSRIEEWKISIVDTVADDASCGLYVIGSGPMPSSAFDVCAIPMSMTINDVEVSSGSGAACLRNPIHAARWLADTLCERGIPLRAGDVVMTGALGPMKPIVAGHEITAIMSDLGSVSTRVVAE